MIRLTFCYWALGLFFLFISARSARNPRHPKRAGAAIFWGLVGLAMIVPSFFPELIALGLSKRSLDIAVGCGVLVVAAIAGFNMTGRSPSTDDPTEKAAGADRFGNRLFLPALLIPFVALICAVALKDVQIGGTPLFEKGRETLVGLGVAVIVALIGGYALLRPKPLTPVKEGQRLMEAIGWAAVLPLMLSVLGLLFKASGVGDAVSYLASSILSADQRYLAVVVYCVGMALFTMIMGNAFAAFPVMTSGIGLPLIVSHGGNVVVMGAVGMLAGFCGTLMTPMAANYNIVPAVLLELDDQHGPIKAQIPTALALLACNIVIMSLFVYR